MFNSRFDYLESIGEFAKLFVQLFHFVFVGAQILKFVQVVEFAFMQPRQGL